MDCHQAPDFGKSWDSEKIEWLWGLACLWRILGGSVADSEEKVAESCIYTSILDTSNSLSQVTFWYSSVIPSVF